MDLRIIKRKIYKQNKYINCRRTVKEKIRL